MIISYILAEEDSAGVAATWLNEDSAAWVMGTWLDWSTEKKGKEMSLCSKLADTHNSRNLGVSVAEWIAFPPFTTATWVRFPVGEAFSGCMWNCMLSVWPYRTPQVFWVLRFPPALTLIQLPWALLETSLIGLARLPALNKVVIITL